MDKKTSLQTRIFNLERDKMNLVSQLRELRKELNKPYPRCGRCTAKLSLIKTGYKIGPFNASQVMTQWYECPDCADQPMEIFGQ